MPRLVQKEYQYPWRKSAIKRNYLIYDISNLADCIAITYIHSDRASGMTGASKDTIEKFNQRTKEIVDKMQNREYEEQMKVMARNIRSQDKKMKGLADLKRGLVGSDLLNSTLGQIADLINEGITSAESDVTFNNYMLLTNEVDGMSSLSNEFNEVDNFFNLILKALDIAGVGINKEALDLLSGSMAYVLYGTADKGTPTLTSSNKMLFISASDLQLIEEISSALITAAGSSGGINAARFPQLVSDIFYNKIGAALVKNIVAKGYEAVDEAVGDLVKTNSRFKLSGNDTFKTSKKSSGASTVSIFNTKAFQLNVTQGEESIKVDIAANIINAEGGFKRPENSILSNQSVYKSTTFGELFNGASAERYATYNALVHGQDSVINPVKTMVAATFIDEWLNGVDIHGTGSPLQTNLGARSRANRDTGQFFFSDGKLYSIPGIVENICKTALNGETNNLIRTSGVPSNKWRGSKSSVVQAKIRSTAVNKAIDTFTIGMTLNSNIFLPYL